NPNPLSYVLGTYSMGNSSLSLLAQKRVNSFYSQVEYLPQLEYYFYKQQLGASKVYLESSEKFGNLTNKTAYSDVDDDAVRLYAHNTFTYVDKIKWFDISPYVGAYTNHYSKNIFGDEDIWRVALETGATLSTKMYRVFDADWSLFGEPVEKMRHVLTPEVTYRYVHEPTVSDDELFQFEDIDSLTRTESVVFALKNKLQVRNKEKSWDFVYFSPSFAYNIHPEGGKSRFTTIAADLEIYPREGISLNSDAQYDVATRRFSSFNADLTFSGKTTVIQEGKEAEIEKYSFSYGHRYSRQSSTQGTLDFRYQLTPKVKFKGYVRCEYNTGDFQEQQYAIRTDLHCWWMDIGIDLKRRSEGSKDTTFWVMFRCKAFPEISVDFDQGYDGAKKSY
ncbi:MAG: LPS assembly protein LptD, partial [Candidatus Omnitrophota bacterium]